MTREELLELMVSRSDDTKKTLENSFNSTTYSATSLRNQLAIMAALGYLVDHTTQQAWRDSEPHDLDVAAGMLNKRDA